MVNGRYYCSLLQDKVRPALHCKQPELLEHGVTLLQDKATPHRHHDVQNLVQCWGWEVLAHPPYSPDLPPGDYWLFAHVKEHLRGKRFESEDDINTAVTAFLNNLSKDEYRAAIDHLPCRWHKCVDSAGDYTEKRTYLYTFRSINSDVILYFVITIKSYTKLLKWPT
jgi:histone-lysine N-methyltransferase SETMAR